MSDLPVALDTLTGEPFDKPMDAAPARTRRRRFRLLRSPMGIAAVACTVLLGLLALFAPMIWGAQAEEFDTSNILAGPSPEHWFGTDALGRDILARVLVATQLTVGLALGATSVSVVLGLILGAAPLLLGRRIGSVITWGVNIAVAFPGLLLALFFAAIFGPGPISAMFAIGLAGAPSFARLCQTLVASVEGRDFVSAARIVGAHRPALFFRHVLPNIGEPLVVNATIGLGGTLLAFAGLSFLGLGVQAPAYDWGRLMQEGLAQIYSNPASALAPGVAVVFAGLAFNLLGEAIAKDLGVPGAGGVPFRSAKKAFARAPREVAASTPENDVVLDVQDLRVTVPSANGPIRPVRGVSFAVGRGQAVGIVGESGSGKSLTALAIAQLIEEPVTIDAERLEVAGKDVRNSHAAATQRHLGKELAMVFQDPMTSFNPTMRMGKQLAEVSRRSGGMTRKQAMERAVYRLGAVKLTDPERRARQYPHEFSGGMRQRAMIGMGIMGTPSLIIADEPTTALDVTVQKQVLELLARVRHENDVALVLISHDVAVVREVCDRVLVMYAGKIVEDIPADRLVTEAKHPYTRALVAAVPDMTTDIDAPLAVIPGRSIDPANVPTGCAFADRCPLASARCREEDPALVTEADGRRVACWHAGEPLPLPTVRAGAEPAANATAADAAAAPAPAPATEVTS
ncbi:dipeptide/oligopeptide/nickel ABC transporter permease/ATP-binding protein [Microbacterium sp. C7(2022)]|uniref:dipeptide/oligopeptide/nickel ABC transporter permease/ATP-binding protein n=1 Tax=Microbacterium sp. C7(2022) TaxID=2992759 RepID=UPI00237B82D7|nr:dipeptide/oligopeptide/nickel ABC transporter permease/ATP-binding protein [Microbacterium sp. C7(2022)]MDE0545420.1 dipeptide/oligopeptide/nickel ABC transporter permease/ATP-binding protein [Microbacterium sp. C7(2022)]